MSEIGERLAAALAGRYALERELGAGGMATVYLAEDLRHRRKVAIKVLRPELAAVIGSERFLTEIRTTANLQHPHIIPLHDSGEVGGTVFYVMPFIAGESLRDRLTREKQLPIADAVRIATEVAGALDYAHRQGVIHRDIKPENILLHDGRALVADFGIALAASRTEGITRLTETGMSLGTPTYMSPEQAMGERTLDARTDVYALGCVLYEMLAGEPPFTGPTAQAIVAKVMTAEPEPVERARKTVPPNVAAAVETALAKLPADRFGTAAAFAAALVGGPAARPSASGLRRASRARSAAGATLLLAAGAVLGWAVGRGRAVAPAAAGAQPVRLTHAGAVGCAAVSPDGREFAAVMGSFDEETNCSGRLIVRSVPSGPDQVIAAEVRLVRTIAWSPSGNALLISGSLAGKPGGVWILPKGSGVPRQLAAGLASSVGFIDDRHVFVNGKTAALSSTGSLPSAGLVRILDVESGTVADSVQFGPWMAVGEGLAWSPTGQLIAVPAGPRRPRLYLTTRSGQPTDSLAELVTDVAWLGERRLAYYRDRAWGPGDIMVRSVDPRSGRFVGEASVLWAALPATRSFSATRAGDRFMVVVRPVVDEQHVLSLTERRPGPSRILVRSFNAYLGNPSLSPDGSRVAYSRQDALGFNPYWIARAGGPEHPISSDTLNAVRIGWLGAGEVLTQTKAGDLTVVDLETGRIRRVASPAGQSFIGAAGDTWLWMRGRELVPILRDSLGHDIDQAGTSSNVRRFEAAAVAASGARVAQLMGLEDGRTAVSTFSRSSGTWSAPVSVTPATLRLVGVSSDGTVYFSQFTDRTEIWRSRGAESPQLFARLPIHCYNESVVVSDDGSTLVCNVTTSQPDAWLVALPGNGG